MSEGRRSKGDFRHRGREAALQILYQWEIGRTDVEHAAQTFFDLQWPGGAAAPDDLRGFAVDLAHDTVRRLAAVDALIADTAEHWRPERMAVLDRLILRMAACELLRHATPDSRSATGGLRAVSSEVPANTGDQRSVATPAAVIINEALELARTFSTEDAVKFINGMLDGIRKKIEE